MPIFQVIVLAVVQGLTEFLPISSTAHLYLTSWLLGWQTESLQFDIMLHLGTLAAILIYFFRDWVQIVVQGFGLRVGTTGPQGQSRAAVAAGGGHGAGGSLRACFSISRRRPVAHALGDGGDADRDRAVDVDRGGAEGRSGTWVRNWRMPWWWGWLRRWRSCRASSRSGITISAGLFRNLTREAAARFSFLLSTPAIGGAAAKRSGTCTSSTACTASDAPFVVGVVVSAVTGCAVIAWFLHYLRRSGLRPFVYYRVIFGIIVLALAFIRRPA